MEKELENPATTTTTAQEYTDEIDSCCSTPYVSAPSSPGRDAPLSGYYYSAPASPMHFMLSAATNYTSSASASAASASTDASCSFDFDFSATLPSSGCASPESMTSADELFCNGQIRPMKLSSHLRRSQQLDPLIESDDDDVVSEDKTFSRGRELKFRSGSLRRRARSMSPMRSTTTPFHRDTDDCKTANTDDDDDKSPRTDADANNLEEEEEEEKAGTTSEAAAACASRSSSSKRWVFLKEFLYRSKSEGRNDGHKFWGSLSAFSPVVKDKKMAAATKMKQQSTKTSVNKDNNGKRRPPSAHEVHYNAKRAQAEEMRKKTFLPYRQGLFGCLGFNSKSYAAINGFARAFNTTPVSSR